MESKPQRHDKQKILESLRERHHLGLTLMWSEFCCENRTLALSAKNAFGSWGRALTAAGIDPDKIHAHDNRKWNTEIIIAAIQERHQQNKSLVRKDVFKENRKLVGAAWHYFGSWYTVLEAAGIDLEDRNQKEK